MEVVDTSVTKVTTRLQQLSQDEPVKKRKGPGTPSGRLALPDLLNMADVDSPSRILAKTPDERVSWNHDPAAYSSSNFEYGEKRGTKRQRARSSSPMSSPARSTHFGVELPVLPAGQLSINTPNLGPGLDLWSNYGMSGAPSASGLQNPLMAQLMSGTPPSARKLAALTRSVSCGDQVAKKRKVGTERSGYDLFADIAKGSVTKHPRVGALLDNIKEKGGRGLRLTDSGPSSSSPRGLRHQEDADMQMESSPLTPRTMGPPAKAVSAPEALNSMLPPPVATPSKVAKAATPKSSPETDYGDDEYDDAIFHEASLQVYGAQDKRARQPSSSPSKRKAPLQAILQADPLPRVQQILKQLPVQSLQPKYVAPANRQQGQPQLQMKTPLQQVHSPPKAAPISRQATLPAPKQPASKPVAKPAFVWKEEEDEFAGIFSDLDDAEIIPDADVIEKKYNAQAAAANSNTNATKETTTAVPASRPPLAEKPVVRSENIQSRAKYVAPASRPAYQAPTKAPVVATKPIYKPPSKVPVIAEPDEDYDKFFDDDDDDFGMAAKQVEEAQQRAQQVHASRSTATSGTSGTSSYPPVRKKYY